jgi:hypothetical protein
VKRILIRVHGVKPAHQRAIKSVKTPTEVGDQQTSIQLEHALGAWTTPNLGHPLSDVKQFLGTTDFEVDGIESSLGILRILIFLLMRL